jgi:hypothetical protein
MCYGDAWSQRAYVMADESVIAHVRPHREKGAPRLTASIYAPFKFIVQNDERLQSGSAAATLAKRPWVKLLPTRVPAAGKLKLLRLQQSSPGTPPPSRS